MPTSMMLAIAKNVYIFDLSIYLSGDSGDFQVIKVLLVQVVYKFALFSIFKVIAFNNKDITQYGTQKQRNFHWKTKFRN